MESPTKRKLELTWSNWLHPIQSMTLTPPNSSMQLTSPNLIAPQHCTNSFPQTLPQLAHHNRLLHQSHSHSIHLTPFIPLYATHASYYLHLFPMFSVVFGSALISSVAFPFPPAFHSIGFCSPTLWPNRGEGNFEWWDAFLWSWTSFGCSRPMAVLMADVSVVIGVTGCYWVLLANQHIALSEWKRMCSTEIENQNCLPNFVGCTASRGLRLTINNMLSPAQYPNTFFFFYLYVATTPYTYQRKYANLVLPKPFKMSPKKNVDIFVFWFCSATWFFEVNFISK